MKRKRSLDIFKVKSAFEKKLLAEGLSPADAKKAANSMQSADLDQVHRDLARHPKLIVINKQTDSLAGYTREDFSNIAQSEAFIRSLAGENDLLYNYLCQYFHQGGFMHLSELLMAYYYAPNTRLITDGRVATFTVEKDGSLTYEEKFDITNIHSPTSISHATPDSPIVTLTLQSKLQIKDGKIEHKLKDLKLDLHDKSVKLFKLFENKLKTFVSWLENCIKFLFDQSKNQFEQQIKKVKRHKHKS